MTFLFVNFLFLLSVFLNIFISLFQYLNFFSVSLPSQYISSILFYLSFIIEKQMLFKGLVAIPMIKAL